MCIQIAGRYVCHITTLSTSSKCVSGYDVILHTHKQLSYDLSVVVIDLLMPISEPRICWVAVMDYELPHCKIS